MHAGTCKCAATFERARAIMRTMKEIRDEIPNDTSSIQQKTRRDQGPERDGDIDWDKGGLSKQMLTLSLTMENELRELRGLFVHTFFFSEETEVKCIRSTEKAYQVKVEATKSRHTTMWKHFKKHWQHMDRRACGSCSRWTN